MSDVWRVPADDDPTKIIEIRPVTITQPSEDGPAQPAHGRNGRWVRLGDVSVDGACIGISDPAFVPKQFGPGPLNGAQSGEWGSGVQFWSGFGDGGYDIWAWIADYGDPNDPDDVDERVAQVVVTMIDESELVDWRNAP